MANEYPCTYCESKDAKALFPTVDVFGFSYEIYQCDNCNAYYLTPPPDEERLALAYDESYYGEGEEKFEGFVEKLLDFFRKRRAAKFARAMGKKGKVLDIGCGNGRFLQFIQAQGDFSINGIEMEGGSAERAKRIEGLKLKVGLLEDGHFSDESLDGISMIHVFEHLTDPSGYLDIIDKILKPGGVLLMAFPNIGSTQAQKFKGDWLHLDPPRHLFFFDRPDFLSLMHKRGYDLIAEKHFSLEYNPFGYFQSAMNQKSPKRELLYESMKGNSAYLEGVSPSLIRRQDIGFKLAYPFLILGDLISSFRKKGATVEYYLKKRG